MCALRPEGNLIPGSEKDTSEAGAKKKKENCENCKTLFPVIVIQLKLKCKEKKGR